MSSADREAADVDWHAVWERKGSTAVGRYDLEALIWIDGFDAGLGRLTAAQFQDVARTVIRECEIEPGTRVLEVGCGAGALLWCLAGSGCILSGVDYSAALIAHARRAVPQATFTIAEAIDFTLEVDVIVCHSVFQYFPDLRYAERALARFRESAARVLVLDVPDLETREQALATRAAAGSKPGAHLYYARSFFAGAKVWTNDLIGYGNGPFRFNALYDAASQHRRE